MEVIFFPRNDYPNNVEICPHRLGKSMTYTEQSDTFRGGAEDIMAYADNLGIKLGVFWGMSTNSTYRDLALPYVNRGMMWIDAYSNPEGANPNTQQVTQEAYEAQRDALLQRIGDWFNIRPVAMSFGYGNTTYADWAIEDFLACRNSNSYGETPYGVGYGDPNNIAYSKSYFKSKASTSRWYQEARADSSFTTRLQQLSNDVLATKLNGGWYNNFTHWHDVIADGNLQTFKDYFDLLASLNINDDIYFAGYGEAVAYLVYRQIITKAVMYSPNSDAANKLVIRLETINNLGIDADLLQVPISIKFSTAGTPLAGKTLTSDRNLVSLGGGDYIVEIPYTGRFPCAIINGN